MPRIEIEIDDSLFEFANLEGWKNQARQLYEVFGLTSRTSLAIDCLGRICLTGAEFHRAEAEGTFPVRVYPIPRASTVVC